MSIGGEDEASLLRGPCFLMGTSKRMNQGRRPAAQNVTQEREKLKVDRYLKIGKEKILGAID